jgi:arabinofuranosyltransferase
LHRGLLDDSGITDERAIYYRDTGLLTAHRGEPMPRHRRVDEGRRLRVSGPRMISNGQIGMLGFFAGPGLHILDGNALTDAFIASLPTHPGWRVGHFGRYLPTGYEESMRSGDNLIADPQLRTLYKLLGRVTRGRLFDSQRLLAIWNLHFGPGRHLADRYFAIHSRLQRVSLAEVSVPVDAGSDAGGRSFSDYGIEVDLGSLRHPLTIEASLESHLSYKMQCLKEGVFLAERPVPAYTRDHTLSFDAATATVGCDRLRFFPVSDNEGELFYVRIASEVEPVRAPEAGANP